MQAFLRGRVEEQETALRAARAEAAAAAQRGAALEQEARAREAAVAGLQGGAAAAAQREAELRAELLEAERAVAGARREAAECLAALGTADGEARCSPSLSAVAPLLYVFLDQSAARTPAAVTRGSRGRVRAAAAAGPRAGEGGCTGRVHLVRGEGRDLSG